MRMPATSAGSSASRRRPGASRCADSVEHVADRHTGDTPGLREREVRDLAATLELAEPAVLLVALDALHAFLDGGDGRADPHPARRLLRLRGGRDVEDLAVLRVEHVDA